MEKLNKKVLAIIPARGNSKSIKNKNLVKLNKKTLIHHLFDQLKKSKKINEIYCSTDSKKIINHCKKIGLNYEIRDKKFAKDSSNISDYLFYILKKKLFDIIILAQPTSPFINIKKIDKMINMLKNKKYNSAQTISKVSHNNHFLNQRVFMNSQVSFKFEKERIKKYNKQRKPESYKFGNIIIFKRKKFLQTKNVFCKPSYGLLIDFISSIDIDTKEDLTLARKLLNK
jgi:CMP-N-acetylneuraminic acid synthetase